MRKEVGEFSIFVISTKRQQFMNNSKNICKCHYHVIGEPISFHTR